MSGYQPSPEFLSRKAGEIHSPRKHGRIPPQALDMEQVVLGAIMLEPAGLDKVRDTITPEMFYKEAHRMIYSACLWLRGNRRPIDLLTVRNRLAETGEIEAAGNVYYLTELTSKVASAANIEHHALVIAQKYMLREIIKLGDEAVMRGYDETTDVFQLQEDLWKALRGMSSGTTGNMTHMPDDHMQGVGLAEKAMEVRKRMEKDGGVFVTGVPSGLGRLDAMTMGFQPGDLVIIGARPSMGKTKFITNVSVHAASVGFTVLFFSLEVAKDQMERNIASMKAGLNPRDVASGKLTIDQLGMYNEAWPSTNGIHVDDTAGAKLSYIRRTAGKRVATNQNGRFIILIDYLQLMSGEAGKKGGTREQEVSEISRGLKEIAKELKCPVVALSQLSRAVESRGGDKKPGLSDLRESGSIEQDADIVIFLYRASYYGLNTYEDGSSTHGIGEVLVAKHRNGPLEDFKFNWDPSIRGWYDYNEYDDHLPDHRRVQPKAIDFGESRHNQEYEGSDRGAHDNFPF